MQMKQDLLTSNKNLTTSNRKMLEQRSANLGYKRYLGKEPKLSNLRWALTLVH